MTRITMLLGALALVLAGAVTVPANADFYQIPAEQVTCYDDRSRLQIVDGDIQFTARWAIGGVSPDTKLQHWIYAQYVDIKLGVGGQFVRYPLEVQSYVENTEECVIAKLTSPLIGYQGQQRAVLKTYAVTGEWGSTTWYRNLDGR